jgi:hypothetical protein
MSRPFFSVGVLQRRLAAGTTEELLFAPGVNLLVGAPNTGKTKWLQTLDHILGDLGDNPYGSGDDALANKYESASAEIVIGGTRFLVERRWHESGAKGKVFVDGTPMSAPNLQEWLLKQLAIPILHFPKGNPMSGQTWPELSFRMLLRHMYRRQRFWGDIADQQPEGERLACELQFLGLAERLFTADYGKLIGLKMKVQRLMARRDEHAATLDDLAAELVSNDDVRPGVTRSTLASAQDQLQRKTESLRQKRNQLLTSAKNRAIPPAERGRADELANERATIIARLEESRRLAKATSERLHEIDRYRHNIADELARLARAEDAGSVLADLKVTNCPACDQAVTQNATSDDRCFLCHQQLPDELMMSTLGATRIRFERDRIGAEVTEAAELATVLKQDEKRLQREIVVSEERLREVENRLAPARDAISAFVQEDISAIDMALGELNERQRQVLRIGAALLVGEELTTKIAELQAEIEPLQARVDEAVFATDFDAAASKLEDGMNAYLAAINVLKPNVWRHSYVAVELSRSAFELRIGSRRWHAVLGGTDSLYFLMAYHYGLLSLSPLPETHYPGFVVIDVPGEFAGEAVEDKENFIVQPFVDLLAKPQFDGAQAIITGASFTGLRGVNRRHLTRVYVAR